ncbi:MAG: tRNA (guanosine(37)-N1)-methyltransferase TrmD [Thiofilum sp.]|uniref:tRNA (guanosine(37)-N1)-methyltransferase TrmD n=1 Tax=Thiofilum sp. TaxID=2212733 RepID=UPI0025E03793|nr:tRNA (guanosine(37)-N1)-methyltransferase TrmD [Thiofilum sp.]MBK8453234.1 tRNA (guanosine(37)-N1)-methyltransferase TrmD [Thiofilum sp.]
MRFDVITLFPELVGTVAESGITGRAVKRGLVTVNCINPRAYATDVHKTVDDRPYGGGPGMVMRSDCLLQSITEAKQVNQGKVLYLSPQGRVLNQALVKQLAQEQGLILVCGRYEGIDERVIELGVDLECSIGDYVLSGGELGAMVIIDAITRLLPSALGHTESAEQDSFSDGLLDCPHYTRPEIVQGLTIPEVLKSGNHSAIARWRRKQSLGRTWQRRPDLLQSKTLSQADQVLLEEYRQEQQASAEVLSHEQHYSTT